MSEKIPESYLCIARPDLIKEWHPTKNGKSNPRNVTCDHAEQVWWLCENGHEWEATVKSRMAGDRCPLCVLESVKEQSQKMGEYLQQQQFKSNNSHVSEKTNDLFQEDSDKNYTGIEFRKYKRYKYKTTAMLEDLSSENRTYAQMKNISRQGMYFETSAAFTLLNDAQKAGTKLVIGIAHPTLVGGNMKFDAYVSNVAQSDRTNDDAVTFDVTVAISGEIDYTFVVPVA